MSVAASQRFSRLRPCPICGGQDHDRRHRGVRCYGYLSLDGKFAFCTRDEYAGLLEQNLNSGTYTHRLEGKCGCGVCHDEGAIRITKPHDDALGQALAYLDVGAVRVIEYEIRDLDGQLVAVHVRHEYGDGEKEMRWRSPDGAWSLRGRPVTSLPLYGCEQLPALDDGARVVACEGETAAKVLRERGHVAVGTVTGARACPDASVLAVLERFDVVYWPDSDAEGLDHMLRMHRQQAGRFVVWPDAPPHGDAADFEGDDDELTTLILGARDPIESGLVSGGTKTPVRDEGSRPDPETLRHRLADGMERLQGWQKASDMRQCGERFRVRRCANGHYPAFPLSCGSQICSNCGPRKLARDWRQLLHLPDDLRLFELRSLTDYDGSSGFFNTIRARFAKWRHGKVLNAVYGVRLERAPEGVRPVVLLILPEGETLPEGGRAFDMRVVAEGATSEDALGWLQEHYLDESAAWETEEELEVLLTESKKRRRFQSFGLEFGKGGSYAQIASDKPSPGDEHSDLPTSERKSPPSGGAGKSSGSRKGDVCPLCGADLDDAVGFTVSRDEVVALQNGRGWAWKGASP
ncbi:MAG: hypothetical protein GEU75_06270 [Dehalococcoidia bacterium]|nr:hypothetical protein [Dehalococcoidia bacterium]